MKKMVARLPGYLPPFWTAFPLPPPYLAFPPPPPASQSIAQVQTFNKFAVFAYGGATVIPNMLKQHDFGK